MRIILLALLAIMPLSAMAEDHDLQSWNRLTFQKSITKENNYNLSLELQQRQADNLAKNERYIIRPALSYYSDLRFTYTIGYAWVEQFLNSSYEVKLKEENRPWEQIQYKIDYQALQIQLRLRQEQRIFQGSDEIQHRSRFLTGFTYFLAEEKKYALENTYELFINLNTVNNNFAGYDRARIFLGPSVTFDNIKYTVGYIGEHVHRFGGEVNYVNAISTNITESF